MTNLKGEKNRGYTLVEVLVAVALGLLIVAVLYNLMIVQQRSYANQNNVAEMQQNVRTAMNILTADLRMAGFGFSVNGIYNATAGTVYAVTPNNSSSAPDGITLRYGVNPDPNNPQNTVSLSSAMANSNTGIPMVVSNATGFQAGDAVIITDGQNAACLTLSGNPSGNTLPYNNTPSNLFPAGGFSAGSQVLKLKVVSYRIHNHTLQCQINGGTWQDVVYNIEDLQLGYAGTGTTPGNWVDNPNPVNPSTLNVVQVNVVGRSAVPDPFFDGQRPPLRDHASGPADHFRRRVLTSVVRIRNL